jgi:hypothetical protein
MSVTGVPRRTGDPGYVVSAALVAVARVEAVITKSTGVDVDELYSDALGINTAVRDRVPTAKVNVDPDAVPLLTATGLPKLRVPSLNWTVPVAVAGVIVAVSVTGVPCATGEAGDVVSAVVVATGSAGGLITSATGTDVDGLKAAVSVGVNTAVSWCGPAIKVDVDPEAPPLLTVTGLPRVVAPSLNCTLPTAVAGVIVAVSVTGAPCTTGEAGDVANVMVVTDAPATVSITGGDVAGA